MRWSYNTVFNYTVAQKQSSDPRLEFASVEAELLKTYPECNRGDCTIRHVPVEYWDTPPASALLCHAADPRSGIVKGCYAVIYQQFSIPSPDMQTALQIAESLYRDGRFVGIQATGNIFSDQMLSEKTEKV